MTKTDLLEVLRNGENSGVEFKRDSAIDVRQLAKEIVALANFRGGMVLLGVEDDGSVSGITRANLEEWVMTACRDKIRPEIIPYFEIVREVEPGKDVGVVRIDSGWTVHHVWHDHHRTYYIRVGSVSREASQEELERLFQQRGGFRLEIRPVSGSSMDDLDRRRLRDYFDRVRQQPDLPPDDEDQAWTSLLVNTEILADGNPPVAATVAGLLLFGTNPNRFLPHAGIDAVAYGGREKEYEAVRATLRGPMTPLFSGRRLAESGLVEQAVSFIEEKTTRTKLVEGARREKVTDYPAEAIREAVVNALVHRDYLLSASDIEISIYSDRLEIASPGRLPNGITPARMRAGCRAARNQLLKDVMRDYGYLEHMGMGIPRKIIQALVRNGQPEPDLVEEGETFRIRLWKRKRRSRRGDPGRQRG